MTVDTATTETYYDASTIDDCKTCSPESSEDMSPAEDKKQEDAASNTESNIQESSTSTKAILPTAFLSHIYNIPLVKEVVCRVRDAAEHNKYAASLWNRTQAAGRFAQSRASVFIRMEAPLKTAVSKAAESLERLPHACSAAVRKPITEVGQSAHKICEDFKSHYCLENGSASGLYPAVAMKMTIAVDIAVDRVEQAVNYVLPPVNVTEDNKKPAESSQPTIASPNTEGAQPEAPSPPPSITSSVIRVTTLAFNTIPMRLYSRFQSQIEPFRQAAHHPLATAQATISAINLKSKEAKVSHLPAAREHTQEGSTHTSNIAKQTPRSLPACLPYSLQPFYESTQKILSEKLTLIRDEMHNQNDSAQEKFFNIVRIGGEKVPLLEPITNRFYETIVTERRPVS